MWWLWILIGIIIVFVIAFLACAIIMGKAAEACYYETEKEEGYEDDIPKEEEIKKEE